MPEDLRLPVAVNVRSLGSPVTGVQRYTSELIARWGSLVDPVAPNAVRGGASGHCWEQAVLPLIVRDRLLFSPANSGPLAIENQVVTIHDVSVFDLPESYGRAYGLWYRSLLPRLARRVRKVITVSEYAKSRIASRLRIRPDRIAVVHNGVDGRFSPAAAARSREAMGLYRIPSRTYLVCVATPHPCKNHRRLLEAWRRAQKRLDGRLWLILVGGTGPPRVFGQRDLGPLPERTLTVGHIGELLPSIYAGALASLQVSLSESFGLPVIESMACGTPVLASDAAALPEVAGDAALLVDPLDVDSIAGGIERIAEDAALRDALREKGLARSRLFSWDEAAQKTWEILLECANSEPRARVLRALRHPRSRDKKPHPAPANRPPKIGLNISTASGNPSGVGHFAFQLARYLPGAAPDFEWVFFGPSRVLAPGLRRNNAQVVPAGKSGAARVLWQQTALPIMARAEKVDLLHGTDFSRPIAYDGITVNTIHDLSPFADSRFFSPAMRAYKQAFISLAARRSAAIITVSDYSRGRILAQFPQLAGRVFAIHNGVEMATGHSQSNASGERPFLLFVGTLENRKNLVLLIRAFHLLRHRRNLPHRLVLVGKPGHGWRAIEAAINQNGVQGAIEVCGYIEEKELAHLYRSATALVYPSLYEGFGLPVLEGMAHGTPVVCSNATSLPEVGGDAVEYFDPHNVDDMAAAIERVLDSPSLQAGLREKGLKRASQFTWEECARKHIEVYRKVLAQ